MKAGAVLNKTEVRGYPFRYLGEELLWPEKQNGQEKEERGGDQGRGPEFGFPAEREEETLVPLRRGVP